ncbi:MAG: IS1595 family transposase [Candidatus Sulfotelmatobacter sp.]
MAGTIFEKTTTKLRLWLYAMYLMASTRCGISAKQIQRETGVTYKTAWRMFKQIRSLLAEELKLEGSSVEMDELYFGGRPRGKRRGPKWLETNKKSVVAGVVERKGKVIARVVEDASKKTLQGFAHQFILPESTVFTDEHPSYTGLDKTYTHHRIQHAAGVYVRVEKGLPIHTQCIEGFWSTVQNGIRGVYHSVSKKYLQTYLDEYSFRYNRRDSGNLIFHAIFDRAVQPSAAKPDPTDGKKTAEISVPF